MSEDDSQSPNPAFAPVRALINLTVGRFVLSGERVFKISELLDYNSLIALDVETGKSAVLSISELKPLPEERDVALSSSVDLHEIADKDWHIAQERYAAIKPLLGLGAVGRHTIEARAKELNLGYSTVYRWLQRFTATGVTMALIPQKRGWKNGNNRLSPAQEKIIEDSIKEFYLTHQRPSAQKTVRDVNSRCFNVGIAPPSPFTIRSRIANIPDQVRLKGRGYSEKARNKYEPAAGTFPNADFPLAVVQIDHTPADIDLVDDVHRKPIGRAWITLAMDVYSRMITGYYLSFDPPSEISVGICLAHSILPKEEWLIKHQVDAKWPVHGTPYRIHVDNGAEFRSRTFRDSLMTYSIKLTFRPPGRPRTGGHIERVIGSLMRDLHALPGTTFSSVKDRDGYNSSKKAAMTRSELEKWLLNWICKYYHERLHSGIGMKPSKKWEIGIFGNNETRGVGMQRVVSDRHTLTLDFLPAFRRTVQTKGVSIDGVNYYSEALRYWINATESDGKQKKEFTFRRDPRDISVIWFFDPKLKKYFDIRAANLFMPIISAWEYEKTRKELKKQGKESVNEADVIRATEEMRAIVETSSATTKKVRRDAQRRKEHANKVSVARPEASKQKPSEPTLPSKNSPFVSGPISPVDEIE